MNDVTRELDGAIEWDKFGLVKSNRHLTIEDGEKIISGLTDKKNGVSWAQLDVYFELEAEYKADAAQLMEYFAVGEGRLGNLLSIRRQFPRWRREKYGIPHIKHYEAVRALPYAQQDELLTRAKDEGLTSEDLADIKREISRKCPKCKGVMLKHDDMWVCTKAECEHEMLITPDAPKAVSTKGTLEKVKNSYRIIVLEDLPKGYEDGIEVQVTFKRLDKTKAA